MKNIREIVSNNIIELRKKNNLTQIKLAEKINFSDKAISRWEKGEVIPDIETLQVLADTFDVPIATLLEEHHDEEKESIEKRNDLLSQILFVFENNLRNIHIYKCCLQPKSLEDFFIWHPYIGGNSVFL